MKTCHFCQQPITKKVLAEKYKRKVENAKASAAKAKTNGTHLKTKLKKRNDEQIKALREQGLSLRVIAKIVGLSHHTVANSLKGRAP